jgi:hypothetical protein
MGSGCSKDRSRKEKENRASVHGKLCVLFLLVTRSLLFIHDGFILRLTLLPMHPNSASWSASLE